MNYSQRKAYKFEKQIGETVNKIGQKMKNTICIGKFAKSGL